MITAILVLTYLILNWLAGVSLCIHYQVKKTPIQWNTTDKWLVLFPAVGWGLFLHRRNASLYSKWWWIYDRMLKLHYVFIGLMGSVSIVFLALLIIVLGESLCKLSWLQSLVQPFFTSVPIGVLILLLTLLLITTFGFLFATLIFLPQFLKNRIETTRS